MSDNTFTTPSSQTEADSYRYAPRQDVATKGALLGTVNFKPKAPIIVVAICGVALIVTLNWVAMLLGAFFLVLAIAVWKLLQDYTVMEVYEGGVLCYNPNKHDLAFFVDNNDIHEWSVNIVKNYAVYFKLNNQNSFFVETYHCGPAVKLLNKTIPLKNTAHVRVEEGRQKKWKWKNPFAKKK